MDNDLISREALINAKPEFMNEKIVSITKYRTTKYRIYAKAFNACNSYWMNTIKNAPTVEVPENAVNCVLTMFGKCSYNKTGCSDCKIKEKIRKALKNERPHGKWINGLGYLICSNCGYDCLYDEKGLYSLGCFCHHCGADMREADNENNNM